MKKNLVSKDFCELRIFCDNWRDLCSETFECKKCEHYLRFLFTTDGEPKLIAVEENDGEGE